MIHIKFRSLEESEIAKDAVRDSFQSTIERFPDLEGHQLTFTLSMDNSQFKPGPDLFKVKLVIVGKKYGGVILEKAASSLYTALADVRDHTLERLNRHGDRQRVKDRTLARKISQLNQFERKDESYDENLTLSHEERSFESPAAYQRFGER